MAAQNDPYEAPAIHAFGIALQTRRSAAGLKKNELAERLGCTPQYVGQIEAAKNVPSPAFAQDLDTFFQADDLFGRLWKLVDDTRRTVLLPPGFQKFLELEGRAGVLRMFDPLLITGLLQTPDYAREILLTVQLPAAVDGLIAARLQRQEILERERPPRLFVTLDERALRTLVGGAEIMRAQLSHLLQMSRRRDIMIDVVPQDVGAYAGFEGGFTLLGFDEGPDAAYVEASGRGQVVEDPAGVADFHVRYDLIRGHALPESESRRLIESIMEAL